MIALLTTLFLVVMTVLFFGSIGIAFCMLFLPVRHPINVTLKKLAKRKA